MPFLLITISWLFAYKPITKSKNKPNTHSHSKSKEEEKRKKTLEMERSKVMMMAMAALGLALVLMVPQVDATRYIVGGGGIGWTTNVNYTTWAKGKHFYNGDWLFFVYDRNQMNVLEVNKTAYETCNETNFLHNWTTGAGRDVVPLNVTRHYYFISGKGFCYGGMKLAVRVENPPPPPKAAPLNEKSGSSPITYRGQLVLPAAFAIAALWDAFVRIW